MALFEKETLEKFLEKAKNTHGEKYNYSLVDYQGFKPKIEIICPDHGTFIQAPYIHLQGYGCRKCAIDKRVMPKRSNTSKFILDANNTHNGFYSYEKSIYTGCDEKLLIICPLHGEFSQSAKAHVSGEGCPECGKIKAIKSKTKTNDQFVEKANQIHGNKYDYSLCEYEHCRKEVKIICDIHGEFVRTAYQHINGYGCNSCSKSKSKGESLIGNILNSFSINFYPEKSLNGCINDKTGNRLIFDFYLPDLNLVIEFDGIQHFEPIEFFGGEESLLETQRRDEIKNNYCRDNGIKILRIPYWENISEKLFENNIIPSLVDVD